MKNQGISLIALIITIIVIIILAAIVIFTGLGTPDSAQFAAFTNDVDTVYMAVTDKFADLKVAHAAANDYRTNEQIYMEIATGKCAIGSGDLTKVTQWTKMQNKDEFTPGTQSAVTASSNGCQRIHPDNSLLKTESKISLPKVRQQINAWYVMADGRVFNANGYVYNGKTYYNASYYTTKELDSTDNQYQGRATKIAEIMAKNDNQQLVVSEVAPDSGS